MSRPLNLWFGCRMLPDDNGIFKVIAPELRLQKVETLQLDDDGNAIGVMPECDWYATVYDPVDFTPRRVCFKEVK